MRSCNAAGARSRRPMKRVRTPWRTRSGSSRSIVSVKISIRSLTSSGGRFQFSVENAYTANESTPRSIAASTVRRKALVPARWPAAIGSPRLRAHRALPSMMSATSGRSGSGAGRTCRSVLIFVRRLMCLCHRAKRRSFAMPRKVRSTLRGSHLHDLGFFVLQQIVDRLRVVVGQLLDAVLGAALIVAADLLQVLQVLHGVTAHVSYRDPPLLRDLPHHLDELDTTLLGRLWHRQPDDLAVVRRRQPEVRLEESLLDRLHRARVERLDGQQSGFWDVDRRKLLERSLLAVVLDLHPVEERSRCSARANRVELGLRVLDARVHALLGVLDQLVGRSHQRSSFAGVEIIVPIRSPSRTRRMLPRAS